MPTTSFFSPVRGPQSPTKGQNIADAASRLGQILYLQNQRRALQKWREDETNRRSIQDQIASEKQVFDLLGQIPGMEDTPPTPMGETPGGDSFDLGGESLDLGLPPETGPNIPLGGKREAPPLLTELTLADGRKIPIPAVRGQRERTLANEAQKQAMEMAKAEADIGSTRATTAKTEAETADLLDSKEVLTQEMWESLPEFWKARWKPGQKISKEDVGEIGIKIFDAEKDKNNIDKTVDLGDRVQIYYKDGTMKEEEYHAKPRVFSIRGTDPSQKFHTVTDLATGQRVRISEAAWNAAPPGKYSDIKPVSEKDFESEVQSLMEGAPTSSIPSIVRGRATREAVNRGAEVFETPKQKERYENLGSIESDIDRLEELMSKPEVAQWIGPIMGQFSTAATGTDWKAGMIDALFTVGNPLGPVGRGVTGPDINQDAREAIALMWNLSDRVLRERSGKQINKLEMNRILRFSVDPRLKLDTIISNLGHMRQEVGAMKAGSSPRINRSDVRGTAPPVLSDVGEEQQQDPDTRGILDDLTPDEIQMLQEAGYFEGM